MGAISRNSDDTWKWLKKHFIPYHYPQRKFVEDEYHMNNLLEMFDLKELVDKEKLFKILMQGSYIRNIFLKDEHFSTRLMDALGLTSLSDDERADFCKWSTRNFLK